MASKSGRVHYVDILKALAVIGVVSAHAFPPKPLFDMFTTYTLQTFYFVAGYVFSQRYLDRPLAFLRNKIRSLYLPFVAWNLLFVALHNVFYRLNVISDKAPDLGAIDHVFARGDFIHMALQVLALHGLETVGGTLWFLISLFTVNLLFLGISIVAFKWFEDGEQVRLLAVAVLFILGATSTWHWKTYPWYLDTSLVAMSIFYAGVLYRKHFEERLAMDVYYVLFAAIVVVGTLGFQDFALNHYPSGPVVMLVASLAGLYIAIFIAKWIGRSEFLEYIGRNSLFIVALQFLAARSVSYVEVRLYHYPAYRLASHPVLYSKGLWWVAYALVSLFVPLGIKYALDRTVLRAWADFRAKQTPAAAGATHALDAEERRAV